jgi:hypothetical protein
MAAFDRFWPLCTRLHSQHRTHLIFTSSLFPPNPSNPPNPSSDHPSLLEYRYSLDTAYQRHGHSMPHTYSLSQLTQYPNSQSKNPNIPKSAIPPFPPNPLNPPNPGSDIFSRLSSSLVFCARTKKRLNNLFSCSI